MHFNTSATIHENVSDKTVGKYRLYNLLFNGRITLQEYNKALRVLNDSKKEN